MKNDKYPAFEGNLKKWLKQLKLNESTISMLLGAFVVIIVGSLLYNYFKSVRQKTPTTEPTTETTQPEYQLNLEEEQGKMIPSGLPVTHQVVKGEHLWMISEKYYGNGYNWVDIAKENNLKNPGLIEVDQELTIPKVALRVAMEKVTNIQTTVKPTITSDKYKVEKGDSLWQIAVRAYQDGYQWPKIFQANREILSNPNIIEVEMELNIPR